VSRDRPRFVTDRGTPVPAVTAVEMREVDRVAVEEVGPPLLGMMENAGRTLAGLVRSLADGPVVVLAGDGGNGGGGLCAARHLANHGRPVRVVLDRPAAELSGAAATQYRALAGTDATLAGTGPDAVEGADAGLLVDALVGYGLAGAPRGLAVELVEACNAAVAPVLSLDVPTGVEATTGDRPGVAVAADHLLTLALPKTGLAGFDGDLWLADVGVPAGVYRAVGVDHESPFSGRARVRLRTPAAAGDGTDDDGADGVGAGGDSGADGVGAGDDDGADDDGADGVGAGGDSGADDDGADDDGTGGDWADGTGN
jgi:NAD(P)H-hydrate epimerase